MVKKYVSIWCHYTYRWPSHAPVHGTGNRKHTFLQGCW